MENIEELEAYLKSALVTEVWGNLSGRSSAWANMRKDGVLPPESQFLGRGIETDLLEYGFSLLRAALRYSELKGDENLSKQCFNVIGRTFESLSTNASKESLENDYYKIISGTSYHLAGFSAMAYSIMSSAGRNITPLESGLRQLILRDISGLRDNLQHFLNLQQNSVPSILALLANKETEIDHTIASILNINGCRAMAYFEFALQTGEGSFLEVSRELLKKAVKLATDSSMVPHYWILRLISLMLDDLWSHSLHVRLPINSPENNETYSELRQLFITSLYSRKSAEVELWPSQLEAAERAVNLNDDLVVALPTSAGKTRIAEITALMTLSAGRRVLVVTPLRALSAQTERSFRNSFSPLGFKVSSLYGPSGSSGDNDALKTNDIIISTPEKLDFALRNDPSIIDDVGLVILDEGHMIGIGEREIRFEVLVQKLLRRRDAEERRVVCLSAILPTGTPLKELTAWIRNDEPGDAITVPWRPTRQRFGTVTYLGEYAKLNYGQTDTEGFIARFIEQNPKSDIEPKLRSGDIKDITLASAWKFALEGRRVLVFITQANWVESFGRVAMELVNNGFLTPLLDDQSAIARAVQIGEEWLGVGHAAVESLKIGIAIHHGKLPSPFLREMEVLLTTGAIKVTIASPTLSQGLNINAGVLLVPYLTRSGTIIPGEEFANVAGRAGRAFVDVEGLVLHIIKDDFSNRHRKWFRLVKAARTRNIESGLMQIMTESIRRLGSAGVLVDDDSFEYLANSADAWKGLTKEESKQGTVAEENGQVEAELEKLDTIVFGLIEALDTDENNLGQILDSALSSSLWERQVSKLDAAFQKYHKLLLLSRARLIWKNTTAASRRGYFAMGVSLDSGMKIDEMADDLGVLIDKADFAAINKETNQLTSLLTNLGELLLFVSPFRSGNALPQNWKELLKMWLNGNTVDAIGIANMQLIEDEFIYRLVWALESIRVKRISTGWSAEKFSGAAASCLETGVNRYQSAMLIRAGLPSRMTAQLVVKLKDPDFLNSNEMRDWLKSADLVESSKQSDFPTLETANLWQKFQQEQIVGSGRKLRTELIDGRKLRDSSNRPANGKYRVTVNEDGQVAISTPDFKQVCLINKHIASGIPGQMTAEFIGDVDKPLIHRIGPGRIVWSKKV